MTTSFYSFTNAFKGVTTLTSNDDGTLAVSLDAGNTLTPITYAGGAVPSVPAGLVGLLVDGIAGGAVTQAGGYGGLVDGAPGASTVDMGAAQGQIVLLSPLVGNGPVTFRESGGSGTVYGGAVSYDAATQRSSLFTGNGDGSSYALAGGAYHLLVQTSRTTVVAAGGTGSFSFLGTSNAISLGVGAYTVFGSVGDVLDAGAGTSVLNVDQGFAALGSGRDTVVARGATVLGGTGQDSIAISAAQTVVENVAARLVVYLVALGPASTQTASSVFGGGGSVTVTGTNPGVSEFNFLALDGTPMGMGDLLVGGSAGANQIAAIAARTTIFGAGAGDVLSAWAGGGDVVVAGPGAETVLGNAAARGIPAGADLLVGGSGADVILGGAGADTLLAGSGADTIASGPGGSLVALGAGPAVVNLGGVDTVIAGGGAATVGVGGRALVFGEGGTLLFIGGTGPSTVTGGTGSQTVYAGAGGGVFAGGAAGGNLLVGGSGASIFFGGPASTRYLFANGAGGGTDLVADFDPARDRVALTGFAPGFVAQPVATGGNTTLTLPDATRVTFLGMSGLDASAFTYG